MRPAAEVFAYQRVAGPNPLVLRALTHFDDGVVAGFTEAELSALHVDSAAFAEGRVFVADYKMLSGLEDGTFGAAGERVNKFVYWPIALFVLPLAASSAKPMVPVPVAVKIRANGMEPLLVTPPAKGMQDIDGMWRKAKIVVGNAGSCTCTVPQRSAFIRRVRC